MGRQRHGADRSVGSSHLSNSEATSALRSAGLISLLLLASIANRTDRARQHADGRQRHNTCRERRVAAWSGLMPRKFGAHGVVTES